MKYRPMADAASLDCDVAVVGAGLAGLTAASELGARGLDVRVLEARDRVGGRSLNHRVGAAPDQVVELGGQWVGPGQREVLALAAELGLETFPTHTAGENVLEDHRGRVSRYRGTIPRLNPVALADISQAEARLGRLIRRVSAAAPWTAHGAERLDSQTFATWIRRTARTRLARETLALACRAVFAAEPEELSLLHVLFYSASADGWDSLLDTRGGAQQDRIVGGSQLLATRLAERLDGRIELGRPVRSIHSLDDGVLVEGLAARRAIVAVPPALAGRIEYDPPLPSDRDQLTQRIGMGSVVKCMAIYDRPFWRADGLSGQGLSLRGPVQVTFDNSPPSGTPGVLLGFLEAGNARRLRGLPPSGRRRLVLETFGRLFGHRAATPVDYVERDWSAERWSRGCYAGILGPGVWTGYGLALRRPSGRLHWAGTETASRWMGYFDGAIGSGRRAAREAAGQLGA
ncbi:MAG TPA: flavin monoamine oxidase family protein [Solirubrobacterales bacterium]|nr:flavin monoamine oxidase family protein [Solirubrobacterales bacterium]